tara:strand:- start:11 stop:124 length:114 start_codon:yes stop_codon:yes gene_type:complete
LFECFEKSSPKKEEANDEIDENIESLTKSLDDLKEMI